MSHANAPPPPGWPPGPPAGYPPLTLPAALPCGHEEATGAGAATTVADPGDVAERSSTRERGRSALPPAFPAALMEPPSPKGAQLGVAALQTLEAEVRPARDLPATALADLGSLSLRCHGLPSTWPFVQATAAAVQLEQELIR